MTDNQPQNTVPLPGQPGNPGRPKGAVGKQSIARLAEIRAEGPRAIDALRDLIEQRNWKAIAYVLDKIVPSGGRTVQLEGTAPADVAAALADGALTPDEAMKIAAALNTLASAQEVRDLMARLDALEQRFGLGGSAG